jgi:hypothetical protein
MLKTELLKVLSDTNAKNAIERSAIKFANSTMTTKQGA